MHDSPLVMAERHVKQGKAAIGRHREIIARLNASGLDTREATTILATLLQSQAIFQEDVERLRQARRVS